MIFWLNMSKKKESFLNRIFNRKFLFLIMCFIGCALQLVYLLKSFFSYEYLTVINMEIPEATSLPDIVVCFEIYYMINYTKLFDEYPEIREKVEAKIGINMNVNTEPPEKFRDFLFNYLPPTDLIILISERLTVLQMTQVLYQKEEFVTKIRRGYGKRVSNSKEICPVVESYKEFAMCYTFQCSRNSSKYVFSVSDRVKDPTYSPLFNIYFNHKLLSLVPQFYVTLVRPNSLPQGQLLKWVTLSPEPDSLETMSLKFMIRFWIFRPTLLPSPFGPKCQNYTHLGFTSRIDMRDQCLENFSMERLNVTFHTSVTRSNMNTSFAFLGHWRNRNNQTYIDEIGRIVDECDFRTKSPDCDIEHYIPERGRVESFLSSEAALIVDLTQQPNIKIELQPKIQAIDCIILFESVLGNWFGFSMYPHLPMLFAYLGEWCPIIRAWFNKEGTNTLRSETFPVDVETFILLAKGLGSLRFIHGLMQIRAIF